MQYGALLYGSDCAKMQASLVVPTNYLPWYLVLIEVKSRVQAYFHVKQRNGEHA